MAHSVLALGCTVVTASGCVWYLPALADLRAGPDRPPSRRTAALATLTGWAALGGAGLLLLAATAWWPAAALAATGAVTTGALRLCAAVRRAAEAREAAGQWTRLGQAPLPSARRRVPRAVVAALVTTVLLGAGTAVAVGLSATLSPAPAGGAWWPVTATAVPALVVTLLLMAAVRHVRDGGGRGGTGGSG
ncbi:hypothetical protein [Streptomyces sp. enrichment culture]|uniref:hypothetical protein n=1 Tax=Streptomyces sp. enrichment culture TaxID=1795815 RepID=UPI003F559DD3